MARFTVLARGVVRRPWAALPFAALLLPSAALAARGGAAIVWVADSRRYSGWKAWWTNLYNESHLLFALVTIVVIPLLGLLLGALADFAMARIGINLKSRAQGEH